jgi:hypothetical protein
MLRSAAFASSVVASMPTVRPFTKPASARRCSLHVKTAACVSRSISRRVRESSNDRVSWDPTARKQPGDFQGTTKAGVAHGATSIELREDYGGACDGYQPDAHALGRARNHQAP